LQGQGFTPQENIPRVYLSGVNLRDIPLSESIYKNKSGAYAKQIAPLSLSYRENTLTLTWEGLNTTPGSLTYSYRLKPDEEWSIPSGNTSLQLAEVAAGLYSFDVKVCDGKGNCGTLSTPWKFEIRKALWQNWWFWLAAAIVAMAGLLFAINYREKRYKEKAAREVQLLTSKLHTIELEQKAMQLQMNPHFIFNAIQTIHHQLLNNEVRKAANSLVNFSTLMRTMLEMSRTDKVSLEDEIEFLHAYVRVEQITRAEPIVLAVEIAENIEPFDAMMPSMMLQPVVENAVQHGGPDISLQIKRKGKYLHFVISDNGPGFPEEELNDHKSVALTLLRERVAHMPGTGFVKYFNLEEDGEVKGACVTLNVLDSI
jgi:two-component sensor histidine kinase